MSLIHEDGTGLADAESYASVAWCDAYHTKYGNTDWAAASTTDREIALRKATRYLEAEYLMRWLGIRTTQTQALAWPRAWVYDSDDRLLLSNIMPLRLLEATALLARTALTTELLTVTVDASSTGVRRERQKLGPMEQEIEYTGAKGTRRTFPVVEDLLREYVSPPGTITIGAS